MKPNSDFEKLLKNHLFTSRIISVVIDEAHCIADWGDFRPEYNELGRLQYTLPTTVPIMIASATLSKETLTDVCQLLHMHSDKLATIRRSSDRPNIKIEVRKMKYSLNSYADLAFLIPDGWKIGDPPPPKFLIFFNDIQHVIQAAKYLQRHLPREMQDKVKWFNSDMTDIYKVTELANFIDGTTWGYVTTESFGMEMDIADIQLILQ
ncbi:hypothetical protein PAXRUDRAFT_19609 [Paxillus rubicundulus Ve08.2h10]|uniref:DNA 3'-5' helicase n=1 Tax=Paxillus rubicundulus Ve08.2h10 TaxID=930991 RepID=A0A0D0BTF0_9AGAM|nr:hypothetical protein PAXRUDRAFT_19609 [Paxillus rubicundulus Ve08.2h10]